MTENVMMKPRTRMMWTAAERAEWLALFGRSGLRSSAVTTICRRPRCIFGCVSSKGRRAAEDGALVEVPLAVAAVLDPRDSRVYRSCPMACACRCRWVPTSSG